MVQHMKPRLDPNLLEASGVNLNRLPHAPSVVVFPLPEDREGLGILGRAIQGIINLGYDALGEIVPQMRREITEHAYTDGFDQALAKWVTVLDAPPPGYVSSDGEAETKRQTPAIENPPGQVAGSKPTVVFGGSITPPKPRVVFD